MMTMQEVQEEITQELDQLEGDYEALLHYILGQGRAMPIMPVAYKTDEYLIKGCHAKVWLVAVLASNRVQFWADSNTAITKGLVALLLKIYNGQTPENILTTALQVMRMNQLNRLIGTTRSNGLTTMMRHIQWLVTSLQT